MATEIADIRDQDGGKPAFQVSTFHARSQNISQKTRK
jgi:hypothetical protein